jgi:hypothetical protein
MLAPNRALRLVPARPLPKPASLSPQRRRPQRARCLVAAALALTAALFAPGEASAKQAKSFVTPGVLFGFSGHTNTPIYGHLGGEISFSHYPGDAFSLGLGGFFQAEAVRFDHVRLAFGPQFNVAFGGLELGAFVEGADEGHGTTAGVQATPFLSIGFLSAAFRMGFPLGSSGDKPAYGVDLGLIVMLKAPLPLDGSLISF